MIKIYKHSNLGRANYGWLDAKYHFSFAHYYNPSRMGFGALRVINDDTIDAGAGFDTHPHRNMEIITYVRQGAITHKDNKGNEGRTQAGDVQVMSAGRGIFHSEYNLQNTKTKIFQIWIEPHTTGLEPKWDTYSFPKKPVTEALDLLVSGDGNAPLQINQDAYIYAGHLQKNTSLRHKIHNQAYVLLSEGKILLDGKEMASGDGAEITQTSSIEITAQDASEILIIDVPEI